MMDDDKRDDRAAAGLSDNRRGGGAMAESNVCRLDGNAAHAREVLAKQIVELAKLGERDPQVIFAFSNDARIRFFQILDAIFELALIP
jgi:hypothetical protein